MKNVLICAVLAASAAVPALAATEYTPEQLREMVAAGSLPPQGDAQQETRAVPFPECKAVVRSLVSDVQPQYPVRTLADGPKMLSVQLWTNDAAVVMSCSRNGRLVVQKALYR